MLSDEIVKCPVCNGWGTDSVPIKTNAKPCSNCNGSSVELVTPKYIVYWDLPGEFNYAKRRAAKRLKLFLAAGFMLFIVIGISLLIFASSQITRLL